MNLACVMKYVPFSSSEFMHSILSFLRMIRLADVLSVSHIFIYFILHQKGTCKSDKLSLNYHFSIKIYSPKSADKSGFFSIIITLSLLFHKKSIDVEYEEYKGIYIK